MLASQLGIRLLLWMGATIPRPAPLDVLASLVRVEVTNDAAEGDGFQLTLSLTKDKLGDFPLVRSDALAPFNRVIIAVMLGVMPEVLIDGIITHQQLAPSGEAGMSMLTVMGKDVSIMLDLEEKNASFPNQPDSLIVTQLILQYAQYGLIPQVTPTTDIPIMLERIPRQQETDFRFIKRMGERNGYIFYIEPVTFGVNTAYWGPETRLGIPQRALTMNMGASSNLNALTFSNNTLAPVAAEGSVLEPFTGMNIPIPQLPSLRIPPLASSPVEARRTRILRDTANQSISTAAARAVGAVSTTAEPVRGEGEVDAVRYGGVLRARRLVGVRGVGLSHDGFYYIRRVTHTIQRGDYKQRFTISREGTGAMTPVVIP